jgi:hypothetical protein
MLTALPPTIRCAVRLSAATKKTRESRGGGGERSVRNNPPVSQSAAQAPHTHEGCRGSKQSAGLPRYVARWSGLDQGQRPRRPQRAWHASVAGWLFGLFGAAPQVTSGAVPSPINIPAAGVIGRRSPARMVSPKKIQPSPGSLGRQILTVGSLAPLKPLLHQTFPQSVV